MRKIPWALLGIFLASAARADTAVTLFDSTTHYIQLLPSRPMTQTYGVILPPAPGLLNQVMSIQSVNGSSVTLQWATGGGGGGGTWGSITGTLSNQTDLQNALNAIGISTAAIQSQANAIAVSTGTLGASVAALGVSTGSLGASVAALGISTGTLQASVSALGLSTGTLATSIVNLGVSTGTLQTSVTQLSSSMSAVGIATGTLQVSVNALSSSMTAVGASTGSLKTSVTNLGISTGTIASWFPVSLSTAVTGSLPAASIAAGSLGATVICSSLSTTSGSLSQGSNVTISGTWPNMTVSASGSGGGGGYNVQPATVTFQLSAGVIASTVTVSSNTILGAGTTIYADGTIATTRILWTNTGKVQVDSPTAGGGSVTANQKSGSIGTTFGPQDWTTSGSTKCIVTGSSGTITGWSMSSDQSMSITVAVSTTSAAFWNANGVPALTQITASDYPTISSSRGGLNGNASTWTQNIDMYSEFCFGVRTVTPGSASYATVVVYYTKT